MPREVVDSRSMEIFKTCIDTSVTYFGVLALTGCTQ